MKPKTKANEPAAKKPEVTVYGIAAGCRTTREAARGAFTVREYPSIQAILETYPARPMNGGPLLSAPPKLGKWRHEPKVNGWRALVHAPTLTCYNRHGQLLSVAGEYQTALEKLRTAWHNVWEEGASGTAPWIDCEFIGRRTPIARGTIIVLDWLWRDTYFFRLSRIINYLNLPALHPAMNPKPHDEAVYCLSSWTSAEWLWDKLPSVNAALGCTLFEGVVSKREDSLYPFQLQSPDRETPDWVKHRFV